MSKRSQYIGNAFWGTEFLFTIHQIVMDWKFDDSLVAKMLGTALYAHHILVPLAIVGFFFLIYHNWAWLYKRTKRYRLSTLTVYGDRIIQLEMAGNTRNRTTTRVAKDIEKAKLSRELEKLGIESPPINNWRAWDAWLPQIMALAVARDLKKARKLDIDEFIDGQPYNP